MDITKCFSKYLVFLLSIEIKCRQSFSACFPCLPVFITPSCVVNLRSRSDCPLLSRKMGGTVSSGYI
ncbi:hypothetical protein OIU78_027034 [Salix suchowensis]|nr:hypothetical protein OIU78_027034 [Salix suchowensis]